MTDKKVKALNALEKLLPKMSDYDLNMLICFGEGMVVKANDIEKVATKKTEIPVEQGITAMQIAN